ncbi:uncharacterized protein LOC132920491 isoform X1 [Rhopalosiphum padi]|uniref:uncharacterized protein LOC132920491 isoform X1 n=1 Tax=Rhopalosiphum padi TaxID=40932 RepID=UPI00298E90CC|nr:uncharacterized protein LOC132920491 isoform X1 [Rhopalosiphum padi]
MATEITTVDSQEYKFNPLNFGSLHFTVKASNDAHIALTATADNKPPKYEIFLGGWGNTKSSIRKNNEEPDKVIVDTPKILNGGEARGFWIKWGGGFIGVGKQGEEKPFMSWQDEESLNVLFYGVRSGWGATGVWTIEDNIYINTEDSKEFIFRAILHGSISFSVDSANDAHIVLATKNKESEPMVEVLFGGWKNTASAIRYNKQTPDKVHVDTPQLLCKDTPKKFVIFWRDGVYEVFSEKTKLFEWKDSNPFIISHYGVRTCWGAVGNWHIHGAADAQFKSQVVATPKPKPLKGKAPPAATPGWNIDGVSSGPVHWVHASNGQIPSNALPGGFDATNEQLYVARAEHNGALIPGKLVPSHGVVYIPWGGVENPKENYEVLCNCNGTWVKANNGEIPVGALSSGHTEDGEPLFVGRGELNGSLTVGKENQDNIKPQDNIESQDDIKSQKTNKMKKESDDHDIFGAYVAMEIRNLHTTDAQIKLRGQIRDYISQIVREDFMAVINQNHLKDGLKVETVSQEKKKDSWEFINNF